jgi:hypothetical protein
MAKMIAKRVDNKVELIESGSQPGNYTWACANGHRPDRLINDRYEATRQMTEHKC